MSLIRAKKKPFQHFTKSCWCRWSSSVGYFCSCVHTRTHAPTKTQQQIHPAFHSLLPASRVFWPRSQDCFPERLLLWSLTEEVEGGEAGIDFYFRHLSHWFHVFFFFFFFRVFLSLSSKYVCAHRFFCTLKHKACCMIFVHRHHIQYFF